jgi:hypothetical protein
VLGPDGLSRFKESSRRESARTAILYAFDLIEHDDEDMRNLPFLDRPRWRGYCATPRQASCSMNTLPGTALWCSRTPAGLAPRASCRRRYGTYRSGPCRVWISKTHICQHLRISKSTLHKYLSAFKRSSLTPSTIQTLTNSDVAKRFLSHQHTSPRSDRYTALDRHFRTVHVRLETQPVTLQSLWMEYSSLHVRSYSYSTFCERYNKWCEANNLSKRTRNKKYVCYRFHSYLNRFECWNRWSFRRFSVACW